MKKETISAKGEDRGLRIDQFLSQRIQDLSRNQARKALQRGGVYIGRRRMKICSYRMKGSEKITIYIPETGKSTASEGETTKISAPVNKKRTHPVQSTASGKQFADKDIIFMDESIVAINKPVGIPSQGTRSSDQDTAVTYLQRFLRNKGEMIPK